MVAVVATHLYPSTLGVEDQGQAKPVHRDVPAVNEGNLPTVETIFILGLFRTGMEDIEEEVDMVL